MSATCFGDHCTTLWENSNHFSKPNLRFSQLLLEILMSLSVSQSILQDGGYLPVNTALHPRKLESPVEYHGRPSETKKQYSFPEESMVAACPRADIPTATSSR
jgi:hypothetical protein